MPSRYRLSNAHMKAFRPVKRLHGAYFALALSPAPRTGFACVVSKKVSSRAVDRNKIKRRARSIAQGILPGLSAATYVLYAKSGASGADFSAVKRDIEKLLMNAGS